MQNLRSIPDHLAERAKEMGIQPSIHNNDFLFDFIVKRWNSDVEHGLSRYYEVGKQNAVIIHAWVSGYLASLKFIHGENNIQEPLWSPKRVLDFASGYGRVARHLPLQFPDSEIQTCDIHADAVAFNRDVLRLKSYQSSASPEALELPQQDVIICLSFFSHMPKNLYFRWLKQLLLHLTPEGILIFTAHGHISHVSKGTKDILVGEDGFGFRPTSEQHDLNVADYGATISYPSYVFGLMREFTDVRLIRFQEGRWWGKQDGYMYAKT
jgi:SAM-dependent methyltransferase